MRTQSNLHAEVFSENYYWPTVDFGFAFSMLDHFGFSDPMLDDFGFGFSRTTTLNELILIFLEDLSVVFRASHHVPVLREHDDAMCTSSF